MEAKTILNWLDYCEFVSGLLFLFGFVFLLFRPKLGKPEANLLLGIFTAGLLLLSPRMIVLALEFRLIDLIASLLLFVVGLLLAFVANAKGEYFATRRIRVK